MKKYKAEVTDEEMKCVIVVAKLIIRLLIEYYSNKKISHKRRVMIRALEVLSE